MGDCATRPSELTCVYDKRNLFSSATLLAPHNVSVSELFKQQCEAFPNSSALNAWDGNLTYKELDQRSSRLANLLLQYGVGPEVIVPLCFDKSMWTAVAILAVLQAGGAIFLLDLAFPIDRLNEMCQAINASIVLTSPARAKLAESLVSLGSAIIVDDNSAPLTGVPGVTQPVVCNNFPKPESACYVVFTSGSTGRPKGIIVSHRALVTSIRKSQEPILLQRDSRVLQFGSYAFDLSVYDHLFTLITGACLCVPSSKSCRSSLANSFLQFSANWVILTPSIARILDPDRIPGLKVLCLAGEAITRVDVEKWTPYVRLLGLYGPAEFAGAALIRDFNSCSADSANLGYTYNTVCWVVDPNDQTRQLSDGHEGELVLEGPCLSRGYIEPTAPSTAAFFKDAPWIPASRAMSTQLYLTGDIVYYNQDGSFQFLGRRDTQVKLSGQRVELGEVEYHLRHSIQGAVEILVDVVSFPKQGTASLIAFVQFPASRDADLFLEASKDAKFQKAATQAREYLKQCLPPYMVPVEFFRMYKMPMTMTDKRDRKALRLEAERLLATRVEELAYLHTEDEEASNQSMADTLRTLCEEVLGVPLQTLSKDVGWLQLGGDSLLAMRLVDQARNHGLHISVSAILEAKSLAQLVLKMRTEVLAPTSQQIEPFYLLPIQSDAKEATIRNSLEQCHVPSRSLEDLYPCTAHQLVSIPYMIKGQCNLTLRLRCPLPTDIDQTQLVRAWSYLTSSNPLFRTRLIEAGKGQYYQAVIREPTVLDLETDLRELLANSVVDLFGFGVPLVRAYLNENILVISMHHLLLDGYSFPLVFRDLDRAYRGQNLPFLSFSPFVQWSSNLNEQNREFWTSYFSNFEGMHFPAVPSPGYMPLETAQFQRRLHLSPRDEHTPSNKLRLALAVTFARNLGVNHVVYGDMAARRAGPILGISDMAVPTASILPICVRLDMQGSLHSNLERIQRETSERIEFEGVDKQILHELSIEARDACDYQTVLIIQGEGTDSFPGIFKEATTEYGNAPGLWSLCVECLLSSSSVGVKVRFDENILTKERTLKFLDCFEFVFNAINQDFDLKPTDLKANFVF